MKIQSAAFRPSGFDELGLRQALADRMLPLLVAAMALLAALAAAGWFGTAALARHWQDGAGTALTIQVPNPTGAADRGGRSRLEAVTAILSASPGIADVHTLSGDELGALLRPWLGASAERLAVPLPAVIAVHLTSGGVDTAPISAQIQAAAPGALLEDHGIWLRRLSSLAWSLQACSGLALIMVTSVAAAVIAIATRAGLVSRREAIEIVHGLGATDAYIARRFAMRATRLAATGGLAGAVLAVPLLLTLGRVAAPFSGAAMIPETVAEAVATVPPALWASLLALPAGAALIGFLTAHATVRRWLRQLP